MKLLLTSLLLLVSVGLFARQPVPTTVRTQITDDGETLAIRIDGHREGEKIHLHKTLDVTGWNRLEREAVKLRAFLTVKLIPPFHEISGLVLTAAGGLFMVLTMLFLGVQSARPWFRQRIPPSRSI